MRFLSAVFPRFFLIMVLVFSAGCSAAEEPMRLPVHPERLAVLVNGEQVAEFDIEIASTDEQRAAGLMHRVDLPRDRGMLFVFQEVSQRYFWMKNTPTPLDIVYADENGSVVSIAANTVPFSTDPIPSGTPAGFAFEIHAGLAARLGIVVGAQLQHPVVDAAF